ncbi:MAG: MBL fold metallo-hydrolase [Nanoarchaeota archaeon]|nr:MBL fold metallo-hydrolase [Nanoarchaeota archaeon]
MEVTILGSGGIESVPKPCCTCKRCKESTKKKGKFFRTGPSLFINSANVLIDTPEEIRIQLIREKISKVDAIFYTHWHPDHTMGIRIIEQINKDCHTDKPKNKPIDVYISKDQFNLLDKFLIRKELFDLYESQKLMKKHFLKDSESVKFGKIEIEAIKFPKSSAYYYLIKEGNKKIIYMPCEIEKIKELNKLKNADYLIVHFSWFQEKGICVEFPWRFSEVPVERILEFVNNLSIKNVIFIHIDECHDKTYDELKNQEKKYKKFNVKFAFDGMKIYL